MTVDVHGDVRLQQECFACLLVAFGTVTGDFEINDSALASLHGSPTEVWGDFVCRNCRLKSFAGALQRVGGDLDVSGNQIESFAEAPECWWIKGRLSVGSNEFTTLEKIHDHLKSSWIESNILGLMILRDEQIVVDASAHDDDSPFSKAMKILSQFWGDDIFEIQNALISAGLKDFACR